MLPVYQNASQVVKPFCIAFKKYESIRVFTDLGYSLMADDGYDSSG
jgi:hypothetical protein